MSEDVLRFRRRAADCRQLAKAARDPRDRQLLEEIAAEFDYEADKLERSAEPSPKPSEDPSE